MFPLLQSLHMLSDPELCEKLAGVFAMSTFLSNDSVLPGDFWQNLHNILQNEDSLDAAILKATYVRDGGTERARERRTARPREKARERERKRESKDVYVCAHQAIPLTLPLFLSLSNSLVILHPCFLCLTHTHVSHSHSPIPYLSLVNTHTHTHTHTHTYIHQNEWRSTLARAVGYLQ